MSYPYGHPADESSAEARHLAEEEARAEYRAWIEGQDPEATEAELQDAEPDFWGQVIALGEGPDFEPFEPDPEDRRWHAEHGA